MSGFAKSALIFLGAGIGANLRYWVGSWVQARWFSESFPGGTLVVNASGSFLMGLVLGTVLREGVPPGWRLFLATGVLGGFTTFSTFSAETLSLLENRAYGQAAASVVGHLVLCLLGAYIGLLLARAIVAS